MGRGQGADSGRPRMAIDRDSHLPHDDPKRVHIALLVNFPVLDKFRGHVSHRAAVLGGHLGAIRLWEDLAEPKVRNLHMDGHEARERMRQSLWRADPIIAPKMTVGSINSVSFLPWL